MAPPRISPDSHTLSLHSSRPNSPSASLATGRKADPLPKPWLNPVHGVRDLAIIDLHGLDILDAFDIGWDRDAGMERHARRRFSHHPLGIRRDEKVRQLPRGLGIGTRSEEHTSDLPSLMRISYA